MPKVPDLTRSEWLPEPGQKRPRISIIVPALNEEEKLEAALRSLLVLDYSDYEVIAIIDRSSDRTGEIMDRLAKENLSKLKVVHITALPEKWLGKPNALQRGSELATGEWLLFTDADVSFRPDALARAIHLSNKTKSDHVVIFPTLLTE